MKAILSLSVAVLLVFSGPATASAWVDSDPAGESCGGCGCNKAEEGKTGQAKKSFDSPPPVGTEAVCPVMGTKFKVKKDTKRSEYKSRHYVFCCPGCKPAFDADPKKYADKK